MRQNGLGVLPKGAVLPGARPRITGITYTTAPTITAPSIKAAPEPLPVVKAGQNTVKVFDPMSGTYKLITCPPMASIPILSSDPVQAVQKVRAWFDEGFKLEHFVSANQGAENCESYRRFAKAAVSVVINFNRRFIATGNPIFLETIWRLIIPGQFSIEGAQVMVHSGIGPGLLPGQWGTQAGKTIGVYSIPQRPPVREAGEKIGVLNAAVQRTGGVAPWAIWRGYLIAIRTWAADSSVTGVEFQNRVARLSILVEASTKIPWPHPFFETFLSNPRVSIPSFFQGFAYHDPKIVLSGYFPSSLKEVQADIAQYIVDNEEDFNLNFQAEIRNWITNEEKKLKRKEKTAKELQIITQVLGVLLTLVSAGALGFAISAIAESAVSIYSVRKLTKAQKDTMKKLMRILGISESQIERFRTWLIANAKVKRADIPKTPPTDDEFTVITDTKTESSNDVGQMASQAYQEGAIGQQVLITDNRTGVTRLFIIGADGLIPVPEDMEAKAQVVAGAKEEKGFPWWLLAVPAAVFVASQ